VKSVIHECDHADSSAFRFDMLTRTSAELVLITPLIIISVYLMFFPKAKKKKNPFHYARSSRLFLS
jgi:hypothetical protein